jgi:hypothetical protein
MANRKNPNEILVANLIKSPVISDSQFPRSKRIRTEMLAPLAFHISLDSKESLDGIKDDSLLPDLVIVQILGSIGDKLNIKLHGSRPPRQYPITQGLTLITLAIIEQTISFVKQLVNN